ncbi:MAG: TrkH family potassium uptake protein, partial [Gemmiger sp.]
QSTAKILYGIYLALTVAQILLLKLSGMPWFDSVTLSFGTAGTGGFGILNDSIGSYSALQQGIITLFMILFGINFNFYFFLLLRKYKRALAMGEVRCYLGIIATAAILITIDVRSLFPTIGEAFRHVLFQVSSIITTTGYSTVDFDIWPSFSKTILVMLMFVGACAGSTGGGIKVSRFMILFKAIGQEMKQFLHPQGVTKISMDGKVISRETLRTVNVYIAVYIFVFAASLLLISLDGFDLITGFTAVAATLNNIGPGLSLVGPTQNFSIFSGFSKLVLIFDMLAGRLELFPVLLLFHRETWRKY